MRPGENKLRATSEIRESGLLRIETSPQTWFGALYRISREALTSEVVRTLSIVRLLDSLGAVTVRSYELWTDTLSNSILGPCTLLSHTKDSRHLQ